MILTSCCTLNVYLFHVRHRVMNVQVHQKLLINILHQDLSSKAWRRR